MTQLSFNHRKQGSDQISARKSQQELIQEELKSYTPSDHELKAMLDGNDPQKIVFWAEKIAQRSVEDKYPLNTSQIRNIYGTVKKLELAKQKDVVNKLIMLKPMLAYAVARNYEVFGLKILQAVLGKAIDNVGENKESRFYNFCRFFEAILAYHKFYDEKKKKERRG